MIRVLLVEDDIINHKMASRLLIKWGMEVTVANDGAEAISLIKGKKFTLVLMDLQMPDMDGCEATTIIRALDDPYYKTVPIIAFSASGDVTVALRSYERVRIARTSDVVKLARFNARMGSVDGAFGCWLRETAIRLIPERVILRRLVALGKPPDDV